jgi:hypothetical protein
MLGPRPPLGLPASPCGAAAPLHRPRVVNSSWAAAVCGPCGPPAAPSRAGRGWGVTSGRCAVPGHRRRGRPRQVPRKHGAGALLFPLPTPALLRDRAWLQLLGRAHFVDHHRGKPASHPVPGGVVSNPQHPQNIGSIGLAKGMQPAALSIGGLGRTKTPQPFPAPNAASFLQRVPRAAGRPERSRQAQADAARPADARPPHAAPCPTPVHVAPDRAWVHPPRRPRIAAGSIASWHSIGCRASCRPRHGRGLVTRASVEIAPSPAPPPSPRFVSERPAGDVCFQQSGQEATWAYREPLCGSPAPLGATYHNDQVGCWGGSPLRWRAAGGTLLCMDADAQRAAPPRHPNPHTPPPAAELLLRRRGSARRALRRPGRRRSWRAPPAAHRLHCVLLGPACACLLPACSEASTSQCTAAAHSRSRWCCSLRRI